MDIFDSASVHKLSWDEASQKAEEDLKKEGISIPWHYNDTFGEYSEVLALRAGGAGAVFFVKSTRFGVSILVAVKTLQRFLKKDYLELPTYKQERIAKDFLEEALPWLEMGQHPNIVTVHLLENIIHPVTRWNVPFVFSEFMEKGDLRRLVMEKRKLSMEETLSVGLQICEGLLHAYEHISAHKDLKPENIMVYKDGIYKITDFSAGVMGTPGYMAPEQERGEKIDHHADQFAVGLIMHDVFKGGDTQNEQRKRILSGIKEVLSDDLPAPLKGIITRCLQPEIENRFADVSELKEELLKAYKNEFKKEYRFPEVEIDDSPIWWFNRGLSFHNIGRYASAVTPYKEVIKRYKANPRTGIELIDNLFDYGLAQCLLNLGIVYARTNMFHEAEDSLKEALRIHKTMPGVGTKQEARILVNLGIVNTIIGNLPEAEENYKEALRIFKLIPETKREQTDCIVNLGIIYMKNGKFNEAEENFKDALRIYKAMPGREVEQANCLLNMGRLYTEANMFDAAEQKLKEALKIYKASFGTEMEQAECLLYIGICLMFQGIDYRIIDDFFEANEDFKEALKIYKTFENKTGEARCLMNMGIIYTAIGKSYEAEEKLKDALGIYKAMPEATIEQAKCLLSLGTLYVLIKEFGKAHEVLQKALKICDQHPLDSEQIKVACLEQIGQIP